MRFRLTARVFRFAPRPGRGTVCRVFWLESARDTTPVTDIAAQVGHKKKSLTLDTYGHVLVAD